MNSPELYIVHTRNPRGVFAKAIYWLAGPRTHSLALWRVGLSSTLPPLWLVLEAVASGFRPSLYDATKAKTWQTAYILSIDAEMRARFVRSLLHRLGARYDWPYIRRWGWALLLTRITNRPHRPPPAENGRVYCSEAIASTAVGLGVPGFTEVQVTPTELEAMCAASPACVEISAEKLRQRIERELTTAR